MFKDLINKFGVGNTPLSLEGLFTIAHKTWGDYFYGHAFLRISTLAVAPIPLGTRAMAIE
jgi:hypothetical protein